MDFEAGQLHQLTADLQQASLKAVRQAQRAVAKAAYDVEAKAKQAAPVDTGALRSSISTSLTADSLTADIGPTVHYGIYLELGTRRMAPRPYMEPALDQVAPGFIEAIQQLGGDVL